MSDEKAEGEPTLVEKWIRDQQEWHRMAMEYYDSMVKNEDFLVNIGNAMRGSLLAGKPYPGTEPPEPKDPAKAVDDRFDTILFKLHKLEGELADLKLSVAALEARKPAVTEPASAPESSSPASVPPGPPDRVEG